MVALATGPKRSPFDSMARKRIAKSGSFLRVPIPASRLPLARPPRRGRIARCYLGGAQRDQMNVCTDSPNFRTLLAPACSVRVHGPALSTSVHDIEGNGLVPYAIGSGGCPASPSRYAIRRRCGVGHLGLSHYVMSAASPKGEEPARQLRWNRLLCRVSVPKPATPGGGTKKNDSGGFPGAEPLQICYNRS